MHSYTENIRSPSYNGKSTRQTHELLHMKQDATKYEAMFSADYLNPKHLKQACSTSITS